MGIICAQVFREDGLLSSALGLDWFEGAIVKPDLVLADFYSAFHPTGPVRSQPFNPLAVPCGLRLQGYSLYSS